MANVERDPITGTATTGHEWDGIQELNTPLPKWWVYVFYVTVIWGIAYAVVYPSIPTLDGYWPGTMGYSSRAEVRMELAAANEAKSSWLEKVNASPVEEILADNTLRPFATRGGEVIFKENCAPCHQTGGQGAPGYPTLADDEWIWGGTPSAIAQTITHGVRWEIDEDTRFSEMSAFGADELLEASEIDALADYVVALAGGSTEENELFLDNCASCHGEKGEGIADLGAPALNNQIWLFGGSREEIRAQIYQPQHGQMPSWGGRLSEADIKQVTVYVHGLGGGQ